MASYTLIFIAMIIRNKSVFQNDGYHNETCEVQAFLAQLFGRYGNFNNQGYCHCILYSDVHF